MTSIKLYDFIDWIILVLLYLTNYYIDYNIKLFIHDVVATETISYPIIDNTVPMCFVYLIAWFIVPLFFIAYYLLRPIKNSESQTINNELNSLFSCYIWIKILATSIVYTTLITSILKALITAPRPYLVTMIGKKVNSEIRLGQIISNIPIYDYNMKFYNHLKSFPSGHTSKVTAALFILSIWWISITQKIKMITLKMAIPSISIITTLFIGYSRISNYKHHLIDVICGYFLGIIVSFIVLNSFSNLIKKKNTTNISSMAFIDTKYY